MQVLLEVVGVKRIRSIGLVSVLQPDGSAVLIIEVYKEVVRGLRATTALRRPCLGDDLGAVQRVSSFLQIKKAKRLADKHLAM